MSIPLSDLMTTDEAKAYRKAYRSRDYGTVDERVERGVAFLDRTQPDWKDRVVVNTLTLSSPCDCVLGQVFATKAKTADHYNIEDGFSYAYEQLFKVTGTHIARHNPEDDADTVAIFFGFDRAHADDWYIDLEAAWKDYLATASAFTA